MYIRTMKVHNVFTESQGHLINPFTDIHSALREQAISTVNTFAMAQILR